MLSAINRKKIKTLQGESLNVINAVRLFSSYLGVQCILEDFIDNDQFFEIDIAVLYDCEIQNQEILKFTTDKRKGGFIKKLLTRFSVEDWKSYENMDSDENRKKAFCNLLEKTITRRDKNNEAVRVCRKKQKQQLLEREQEVLRLEEENDNLKQKIQEIKYEIEKLRNRQVNRDEKGLGLINGDNTEQGSSCFLGLNFFSSIEATYTTEVTETIVNNNKPSSSLDNLSYVELQSRSNLNKKNQ
ncbi:MAG: bZIP transcription factor [Rickettsiaceae bacterium H1]|nr:bZIP transcription factor [Rickettsiaceae bacterium H1]